MRIGVVGINHKLADLKLREQLAKACQKRFGALQAVHDEHYFVLLSTCNRTEIYFNSEDLTATHSYLLNILRMEVEEEFDHKLYSFFGADCFCHLTRVTSGLDSAIIAETEIQGQVKMAYESVVEYHTLPKELHYLFQKALGIAKKIRHELQLGRGMPNLEHAILQTGRQLFAKPEQARLLFVGASEINQKILNFLKSRNFHDITLCNRSDEQARLFSETYDIHHLEWDNLKNWPDYDWIIFGTKSPDYLITRQNAHPYAINQQKLIIDLSVPRNVEPKLSQNPSITLLNIDQINRLLKIRSRCMADALMEAESLVAGAVQRHIQRYLEKEQSKMAILAVMA